MDAVEDAEMVYNMEPAYETLDGLVADMLPSMREIMETFDAVQNIRGQGDHMTVIVHDQLAILQHLGLPGLILFIHDDLNLFHILAGVSGKFIQTGHQPHMILFGLLILVLLVGEQSTL